MDLDDKSYAYLSEIALYSTIAFGLIILGASVVIALALYRTQSGGAAVLARMIERAGTLQMITVIVIVVGACILATVGRIKSEGIVSILSGIAGYVLGNSSRPSDHTPRPKQASGAKDGIEEI
ncbi:hypothetical protein [Rhizobium sp. SGZ-381]|uniref:hypothetical protein n=1 Tax=Rhizobium sp. SGZ-381 TaxID=3342800 RepID=UPI00366E316C